MQGVLYAPFVQGTRTEERSTWLIAGLEDAHKSCSLFGVFLRQIWKFLGFSMLCIWTHKAHKSSLLHGTSVLQWLLLSTSDPLPADVQGKPRSQTSVQPSGDSSSSKFVLLFSLKIVNKQTIAPARTLPICDGNTDVLCTIRNGIKCPGFLFAGKPAFASRCGVRYKEIVYDPEIS
jgi:hypothetical protein